MILWFLVVAPLVVAEVFQSPKVDYRFVAAGAVAPSLVALFVDVPHLHTVVGPVVVLSLVMVMTMRRRLLRRRLLGLPIGMFLHLVLDGSWTSPDLFWWPFLVWSWPLLEVSDGSRFRLGLTLDLVAVGVAAVATRRYGLEDPANRRQFLTTGNLDRRYFQ